jgi:hypothetical protein
MYILLGRVWPLVNPPAGQTRERRTYYKKSDKKKAVEDPDSASLFRGGELSAGTHQALCSMIEDHIREGLEKGHEHFRRIRLITGEHLSVNPDTFEEYRNKPDQWHRVHPWFAMARKWPDRVEIYFGENRQPHYAVLSRSTKCFVEPDPSAPEGEYKLIYSRGYQRRFARYYLKFEREARKLERKGRKWQNYDSPEELKRHIKGFWSEKKYQDWCKKTKKEKRQTGQSVEEFCKIGGHILDNTN